MFAGKSGLWVGLWVELTTTLGGYSVAWNSEYNEILVIVNYKLWIVNEWLEDGSGISDDGNWILDDRSGLSDKRSRRSDDRSRLSNDRSRLSDDGSWNSDDRSRVSNDRSIVSDDGSRPSDDGFWLNDVFYRVLLTYFWYLFIFSLL